MAAVIKTNPKIVHLDRERIKRRGDKPMAGPEVLDEFEFLTDAGTHPMLAAQMLGMKYATLVSLANRWGRSELINRSDVGYWNRFRHDNGNQYGRAA